MATVGILRISVRAEVKAFEKGMKKARRVLRSFGSEIPGANVSAIGFGKALTAVAVGGLAIYTKNALKAIDITGKLSDELGFSTEALASLEFAASQTGTNVQVMHKALQRLVRRVGEADAGFGEAVKGFEGLGIAAAGLSKQAGLETLLKISDAIASQGNEAEAAAAGYTLMGRQAQEVMNVLLSGRKGLTEFIDEAKRLGFAFNRIDAQKVEIANDAMDRMSKVVNGMARQFAILVSPFVTNATDAMIDFAITGGSSADFVTSKFEGLLSKFGEFKDTLSVLSGAFNLFTAGLKLSISTIANILASSFKLSLEIIQRELAITRILVTTLAPIFRKSQKEIAEMTGLLDKASGTLDGLQVTARQFSVELLDEAAENLRMAGEQLEKGLQGNAARELIEKSRRLQALADKQALDNLEERRRRSEKLGRLNKGFAERLRDIETEKNRKKEAERQAELRHLRGLVGFGKAGAIDPRFAASAAASRTQAAKVEAALAEKTRIAEAAAAKEREAAAMRITDVEPTRAAASISNAIIDAANKAADILANALGLNDTAADTLRKAAVEARGLSADAAADFAAQVQTPAVDLAPLNSSFEAAASTFGQAGARTGVLMGSAQDKIASFTQATTKASAAAGTFTKQAQEGFTFQVTLDTTPGEFAVQNLASTMDKSATGIASTIKSLQSRDIPDPGAAVKRLTDALGGAASDIANIPAPGAPIKRLMDSVVTVGTSLDAASTAAGRATSLQNAIVARLNSTAKAIEPTGAARLSDDIADIKVTAPEIDTSRSQAAVADVASQSRNLSRSINLTSAIIDRLGSAAELRQPAPVEVPPVKVTAPELDTSRSQSAVDAFALQSRSLAQTIDLTKSAIGQFDPSAELRQPAPVEVPPVKVTAPEIDTSRSRSAVADVASQSRKLSKTINLTSAVIAKLGPEAEFRQPDIAGLQGQLDRERSRPQEVESKQLEQMNDTLIQIRNNTQNAVPVAQ